MVFLEAVTLFFGWYYGILDGAAFYRILVWYSFLTVVISFYDIYFLQSIDLWRSGSRMAFHHLYYLIYQWRTIVMSWYHGTIYE